MLSEYDRGSTRRDEIRGTDDLLDSLSKGYSVMETSPMISAMEEMEELSDKSHDFHDRVHPCPFYLISVGEYPLGTFDHFPYV